MSICFYQKENSQIISPRNVERYRFINIKTLYFYINKEKLTYIMDKILSEFCDITVIGYKRLHDTYWCKSYDSKFCQLHIEVEIINKDLDFCEVKIIPLIGTDKLIDNFISNFKESIELYTTSSFIRGYLERN